MDASPTYLGIAAAAQRVGVTVSTLKRWADDGRVPCVKTGGGHRRFRGADIEQLLEEMAERSGESRSRDEEWLGLLLHADTHPLMAGLFSARARLGAWYRVGEELARALQLLGRRWVQGELGILDEHLASERLHRALGQIVSGIPLGPETPVCLLTTPPGEEHTLGLSIAELCLRESGWRSLWAGGAVPAEDVSRRLRDLPVAMVAAAASPSSVPPRRLGRWAAEVAVACRRQSIPLVLGGGGEWPARLEGTLRVETFAALHDLVTSRGVANA
jgi:MerR family transcriptional regulator, light-induced transcriptional regulator